MIGKICLPIIYSTISKVIECLNVNIRKYDYFEIWVDYHDDFDVLKIVKLVADFPNRLIINFRRIDLQNFKLSSEIRLACINKLSSLPCLIDLDIHVHKSELEIINGTLELKNLLLSFHDYSKTPSATDIQQLSKEMMSFTPEILKISCFCNNYSDTLTLLDLLTQLRNVNQKAIVLGMGEHGLVTRIAGQLMGNMFAFVCEERLQASAPGQLTREEFITIMETLEHAR